MKSNLEERFGKIWSEERSKLLESLKDQPELTNQVLLEMKDSRSFRVGGTACKRKTDSPNYKRPPIGQAMDPDKVLNWHFFVLLALFIGTLLVIYFRFVWESLCWGGGLIQKAKTETLLLLGLSDSERMVSIPVQEWRWHIQDDCKKLLPGHCCEPNVNFDPQNGHLKVLSYLQWFFSTVLSNVCSKLLQQRKQTCTGCIS